MKVVSLVVNTNINERKQFFLHHMSDIKYRQQFHLHMKLHNERAEIKKQAKSRAPCNSYFNIYFVELSHL